MEIDSNLGRTLPFSQRTGYQVIPQQLKLAEVSEQQRRLIDFHISEEIERFTKYPNLFEKEWKEVAKDLHVRFFRSPIGKFRNDPDGLRTKLSNFILTSNKFYHLFDLIEFLCEQNKCSDRLKSDLSSSFEESLSAYRMIDRSIIVAVGNEELAKNYVSAIETADSNGAIGAKTHLINAGKHIKDMKNNDSVRESINAAEAVAKKLEPYSNSLGEALKLLSRRYSWNKLLTSAINKLYAYTNDEKGIRHSLVFEGKANVEEADALFMLGVCASLVTYLLMQQTKTVAK